MTAAATICRTMETPIGPLTIAGSSDGTVTHIRMEAQTHEPPHRATWARYDDVFEDAVRQLREYFEQRRRTFDFPTHLDGTPFQLQVWEALRSIPYGETATYGDIAGMIGNPAACRAVGLANGRNPIAIVVPCHRVIGKGGGLTGYGGGLTRKEQLLTLERSQ